MGLIEDYIADAAAEKFDNAMLSAGFKLCVECDDWHHWSEMRNGLCLNCRCNECGAPLEDCEPRLLRCKNHASCGAVYKFDQLKRKLVFIGIYLSSEKMPLSQILNGNTNQPNQSQ